MGCATSKVQEDIPVEYRAYYQELKIKVAAVWPELVKQKFEKLKADGLTLAAYNGNRESLVRVKVKSDGTVVETKLLKSSGLKAADESAIEVFEQLKVLPPPPQAITQNGSATIRWNFVLEN